MSGVILETDTDRGLERRTIERILSIAQPGTKALQMPALSAVDYLLLRDDTATMALEIKTRKESVEQIRSYGGLMLKHRKAVELQTIGTLTQLQVLCVFAFDNAEGPILICDPSTLTDLEPAPPPRRRNYRGLACDEELVLYLDWDRHLMRVL